jgi:hypothetical protein
MFKLSNLGVMIYASFIYNIIAQSIFKEYSTICYTGCTGIINIPMYP